MNPKFPGFFTIQDPEFGLEAEDTVIADNVFLVFAPARSGHHAIIYFICAQFDGIVKRLNNCDWGISERLGAWSTDTPFNPSEKIRCLTSNYEDVDISSYDEDYSRSRVRSFVRSDHDLKKVIVLRDPYNHLASSLRGKMPVVWDKRRYIAYARQMLGLCYVPDCIPVNYNKWCDSKEYRKRLSGEVGGDKFVDFVDFVPVNGLGSSFDARNLDGRGSDMKTRDRWKHLSREDIINHAGFLFDDEVIRLSREVFGHRFIDAIVRELTNKVNV